MGLPPSLKRAAELLLLHAGPAALSGRGTRGRALILAYHNILPDGAEPGAEASLHLPRAAFGRQLDLLRRRCDVMPLDELLASPPWSGRPRAAITFDDAYRGAVTAGVDELAARGLPATIFVAPAFLGGRSFWWDAVRSPRSAGAVGMREHALEAFGGEDTRIRAWAADTGLDVIEPPAWAVAATAGELAAAAARPGITIGSHTWSHPNLVRCAAEVLERELRDSRNWVLGRFPRVSGVIAYPYGICDARVRRAAASAGYSEGLEVLGGWIRSLPDVDRFGLPRYNVPAGLSDSRFALCLRGLLCT